MIKYKSSARGVSWALIALAVVTILALLPASSHAGRLKDIASVQGVRSNQLLGYGLVVGLVGTGDGASAAPFTAQSLRNMLAQYGVTIPPKVTIRPKNVAAQTWDKQDLVTLPQAKYAGQLFDVGQ